MAHLSRLVGTDVPVIKTKSETYDRFRSLLSRCPAKHICKRPIWAPWVIASYENSIVILVGKSIAFLAVVRACAKPKEGDEKGRSSFMLWLLKAKGTEGGRRGV